MRQTGAAESAQQVPSMILTIAPSQPGKKFAQGSVGLSIEADELSTRDIGIHQAPVALMRLLGRGVLRVGGDSVDQSWWTTSNEEPPAWATSVITPADLVRLRELLVATDWRAILGVDFGHFEPTRAANEVDSAAQILGPRLLGIEIGNEPHGYSSRSVNLRGDAYNVMTYIEEVLAYKAAFQVASPGIRLYGPDLSSPSWLTAIASEPRIPFAVLTGHYYPTQYNLPSSVCQGTALPTAHELLSPQVRQQESAWLQTLVAAGQLAHRRTRISETNTTSSCDASGAPNTGPVFASALWSLDWILRAASAGVSGLNFHGAFGICTPVGYTPLCAPAPSGTGKAGVHVGAAPEYYGLLAARQLEGGRFVPVDFHEQNPSADVTAYATLHSGRVITLDINNLSQRALYPVILRVPSYDNATSESLLAPSVHATAGVTFGGASINAAGILPSVETKVPRSDGGFRFRLAPMSAIVLTLRK